MAVSEQPLVTESEARIALYRALVDVLLAMPELPPELVYHVRRLRLKLGEFRPAAADVKGLAEELSALCRDVQQRQGRR